MIQKTFSLYWRIRSYSFQVILTFKCVFQVLLTFDSVFKYFLLSVIEFQESL